jgi:hypothetical protein
MKREKILKWSIYISGIICLYAFISIRFLPMYNTVLKEKLGYWDQTKYGEMYYFSMIRHFREKGLPPSKPKFENSPKQASVKDCDVLAFGDSFFQISREKQFPERIADDLRLKVHYVNNDQPLEYLEKNNYQDTIPKLVLFERVERYLPICFQKQHTWPAQEEPQPQGLKKTFVEVKDKIFDAKSEELYDVMLKRSYLTTFAYSWIATIKFDLFGYISKKTPVYKVNDDHSWIFYFDQVNDKRTSFYYPFTDKQVDSICENMADLAAKLKKRYHMDIVYLPMPARYTIYHTVVNNDSYNDLLPRLYAGLDKRGVKYINVFSDLKNNPDTLFYRTDEHWNKEGLDLVYNKTLKYFNSEPVLKDFIVENGNFAGISAMK